MKLFGFLPYNARPLLTWFSYVTAVLNTILRRPKIPFSTY